MLRYASPQVDHHLHLFPAHRDHQKDIAPGALTCLNLPHAFPSHGMSSQGEGRCSWPETEVFALKHDARPKSPSHCRAPSFCKLHVFVSLPPSLQRTSQTSQKEGQMNGRVLFSPESTLSPTWPKWPVGGQRKHKMDAWQTGFSLLTVTRPLHAD